MRHCRKLIARALHVCARTTLMAIDFLAEGSEAYYYTGNPADPREEEK